MKLLGVLLLLLRGGGWGCGGAAGHRQLASEVEFRRALAIAAGGCTSRTDSAICRPLQTLHEGIPLLKFKDSFWKDTYVCTLSFIGCNICSLIYIINLWMISIRNCIYIWIKVFSSPASRLIPISATVISIFIACSEKAKSETSCWPRIKLEKK